jgi:hypothetical protein
VSVETVARKWHDQLISSEPIDHNRAESAVRAAYRAAGLPEPKRFLWCASPLEAAWSALVLIGKDNDYNHAVYEDIERLKTGKDKLAKARALVVERLGIEDNEVEGYFGKAFYLANSTNPVTRQLNAGITDAWMARAQAGDDFLAPHAGGPFKPLHDLEHALHFEGERRGAVSLYRQALAQGGGKQIAILAGRSAQHRLYGNFAYIEVAIDEALADSGKFEPSELQRALWAAYEACGMWWPCDGGVVFAERPAAAELAVDGPRMEWTDGLTLGGKPEAKAAPASAATAPAATKPALLEAELPRDHDQRIAFLRGQAQKLPFLDRYLAGEHEQVWADLVGLGPAALEPEHAPDALAVAYETMHRVEQNVATLAQRLKAMDYRFVYPGSEGGFLGLRKARAHEPHVLPAADAHAKIAELEKLVGGPVPLSLRAFFEVVGEVNFNGDHPSLAPRDGEPAPDPLMVCSVDDAIAMLESGDWDDDEPALIEFAPDALHKANISGGAPYSIEVPNPAADAPVEDEPHDTTFVAYLRLVILGWGGFPGWEDSKLPPPPEIERLRDELIRF